jgi:hypothetical protein
MFVTTTYSGEKVDQKKWLYVTLTLFLLAVIENQLIFYGYGVLIDGLGGLVISGGLALIFLVILVIQFIAFLATRKRKK